MFKVNNKITKKRREIYSKLTIKNQNVYRTFTCSRSTVETLEKGVKYVQS